MRVAAMVGPALEVVAGERAAGRLSVLVCPGKKALLRVGEEHATALRRDGAMETEDSQRTTRRCATD